MALGYLISSCKQMRGDLAATSLTGSMLPCIITKTPHARHTEPEIATFLAVFHGRQGAYTIRIFAGIWPACNPPPAHPSAADRVSPPAGPFRSSLALIASRASRYGARAAHATSATRSRLKQNEAAMLSPSSSSQPRAVCSDPACPRSRRAISPANRVYAASPVQHPFTFPKDSLR